MTNDITLLSPLDYQVVQRNSLSSGQLRISGRVKVACDSVEAKIAGVAADGSPVPDEWRSLTLVKSSQAFSGNVKLPAGGWYRVEVRALSNQQVVASATVEHLGIGEVFVGSGQSNSTNSGDTKTEQTSGMVSSFSGKHWQIANDPQPGCHDESTGGSFWPAFGDALFAKYRVPIGVAATGHGGTSVKQWAPGEELFNWTLGRVHELGPNGFRALLWHQGESDVGLSTEEYVERLSEIIAAMKKSAGWTFPWFVAQASYHNVDMPADPRIRQAQQYLWDNSIALRGPDTDTLVGDHRDDGGAGIHFSPKGLQTHGMAWSELVTAYLQSLFDVN